MAHSHRHSHGHHDELSGKKLLVTTILNFTITAAEAIGGILSNSLALLSDALHNLGDTFAVLIAYVANKISKSPPNAKNTFGLKRIEILAALFNAIVLIVITIYLFKEAYERFLHPEQINGLIMFIVAVIGLLANLYAVILLKTDSKKNLNIKAAYLHLLGDTISSVAVIIGSVFIYYFNIYWLDPLITVIIGVYILKEAYVVLKETVDILMQRTPRTLKLERIKHELEKIKEIKNIHHVHIWNLTDQLIHFECHIELHKDMKVAETMDIQDKVEQLLHDYYNIDHVTLQFEYNCCHETKMIKTE